MRRGLALVLAVAMVAGLAAPAGAVEPPVEKSDPQTPGVGISPTGRIPVFAVDPAFGEALDTLLARGVTEIEAPIGPSGSSRIVLRNEPPGGRSLGGVTPEWSVGFGWYIYLYIGPQDWGWFTGLALPVLSVVVCAALASGGISGVVCGLIAVGIRYVIARYAKPSPGYCLELRFTYWGTLNGVKYVRRSC